MKPLIGRKYGMSVKRKKLKFQELRDALSAIPQDDREQRCKFRRRFAAELSEGSAKKGLEKIKQMRFDPYGDCKPGEQIKTAATRWYSLAGMAALLIGAIGFAMSFRKKAY
jgi:hypothetical protein